MVICVQSVGPITLAILHFIRNLFFVAYATAPSGHLTYSSLIDTSQSDTRCAITQEVDCATSNKLASCLKVIVFDTYHKHI